MQYCPNCGKALEQQERFCSNCGFDILSLSQPVPPSDQHPSATQGSQPLYPQPSQPLYPYSQPSLPPYSMPQLPGTGPMHPQIHTPHRSVTLLPDILGESADPSTVQPTNTVQKFFLRNLPLQASHPIMGALLGAIVALVGVLSLSYILAATINTIAGKAIAQSGNLGSVLSGVISQFVQDHFLSIVALEHGTVFAFHISASSSGIGSSGDITAVLPLTTLLLIPMVCLIVGGYVSSSTDYSNRLRFAVGRAALVGPFYGVLLALIVSIWGSQSMSGPVSNVNTNVAFGPTWLSALLYGILWGTVFSAIGGIIKVYGRSWRVNAVAYAVSSKRSPLPSGILGGFAGIGLGLVLNFVLALFVFVAGINQVNLSANLHTQSNIPLNQLSPSIFAGFLFVFLVPLMIWFLGVFSGGTLTSSQSQHIASQTLNSVSLFTVPHIYLLVVIIPAAAFFFGGRVAARLAEPRTFRERGIAAISSGMSGAMVLTVLAWMTQVRVDSSFGGVAGLSNASSPSGFFGLDLPSTFLGIFIIGGVCSLVGVMSYHVPTSTRSSDDVAHAAIQHRNTAHIFLMLGIITAFLTGAMVIGFDIVSKIIATSMRFTALTTISDLVSGVALAIPGLFFVLAFAAWAIQLPHNGVSDTIQESVPPPSTPIHSQPVVPDTLTYFGDLPPIQ